MNNQKLRHLLIGLTVLMPVFAFATEEALDTGITGDEPLPPEQAFVLSTETLSADMIRAKWHIVDGYYMYREKFKFESNTPGITAGTAVYPTGKIKVDEFFGKVETYRGDIAIDIPLNRMDAIQTLELTVTSQGCADIGICYPPQKQQVSFNLPPLPVTSASESKASLEEPSISPLSAIKKLGDSLLGEEEKFLPVDKAYVFTAEVEDGNTIKASWDIADGYYLYRDKITVSLLDASGVELGQVNMPEGKEKVDESFGRMIVYFHNLDLLLPLKRTQLNPANVTLEAKYQGCAEAGLCYPPQTRTMPLSLPAGSATPTAEISGAPVSTTPSETNGGETKRGFFGNLLFAFGIGFLLSFTPCVLPMIPILVGVIVGQSGEKPSKMRSGILATNYVIGTAVVYSAAGWLAGASGQQLQAYTQNAWGIGIVAAILVILALSMFGFYEIQMPSAVQSRLQMKSQNLKGGSMLGTFFLGTVSALIVGACVTPLLMLVLGIAIQTGDPVLGASMMFAMAWGTGVVLIAVGVGAGHMLPKAGAWMDIVKYVFGVLLIGVAIYLMTPLEAVPILLLWGIFLIVVGVYMGATQAVPQGVSKWQYLWKGIGTVLMIWGILALLGSVQGNRDIMQPIDTSRFGMTPVGQGLAAQNTLLEPHDLFIQLESTVELDKELARAKAAGKPVMLDYFATWCTDCRRMEKATFNNPQVQKIMQDRFVALQVDVTDPNNAETEAIKKRFKVFGPPAMLFFDKAGNPRQDLNFYGFKRPEDFIATLDRI
ncbi:MAG: protein-disulfide reductase DsbD [Gammaproteobacteria bacterium]|nr:protein-disulfide reductase DsbD [Gammaproteobacteria bacterium]